MTTPLDSLQFKSVTYSGLGAGPRLIVTGAVHGNETCGTRAIGRVIDDLEAGRLWIAAGTVTFVPVTNPLAYAKGERSGDRNLNRNLSPTASPVDFEDHVANWLCPLLARHDVLLDLHSTRALNPAFAMLGPFDNAGPLQPFRHAAMERGLARRLGARRFVDGWLETYAKGVERRLKRLGQAATRAEALNTDPKYGIGTTEYMRSVGGCAITLECGQHDDSSAPEVGYRAILNALAHLGLVKSTPIAPVQDHEYLSLVDVIDRAHEGDAFSREWSSFNRLAKGDLIGTRHDGTKVLAPEDGYIVFPDHRALAGNEWFYLAKARPPAALEPAA
ncbi:MAG: succinylglutamate desuccinylase/aspartoacylase family protein [Betaproteobacteria bacterium]|nr:succinylglutamate desuccinylase/aspartoacylase family protein [Betaproteobacteria bacterium]